MAKIQRTTRAQASRTLVMTVNETEGAGPSFAVLRLDRAVMRDLRRAQRAFLAARKSLPSLSEVVDADISVRWTRTLPGGVEDVMAVMARDGGGAMVMADAIPDKDLEIEYGLDGSRLHATVHGIFFESWDDETDFETAEMSWTMLGLPSLRTARRRAGGARTGVAA
jgi:hypothetical protein